MRTAIPSRFAISWSFCSSFRSADFTRDIATFTDNGRYRPLKSAPNLRRGWRIGDELLRPAQVVVARSRETDGPWP